MGADKRMYIILSAVVAIWGLNVVMVKYLTQHMDPLIVSAVRMPLAGVVLLPFVWKQYGLYKPDRRQWLFLCLVGFTSIFGHQLLLSYGVRLTSATNSSLILGLNPLTTALLAGMFLGEKLTLRLLAGVCLGLAGVVMAVAADHPGTPFALSGAGDLVMFLAMLAYVLGGLFVRKISGDVPTLVITAYSTMLGAAMLNAAAVVAGGPSAYAHLPADITVWAVMLLSAWGASALGSLGFNAGIKALGAGRTAMFLNGMPFASMAGAVLFLGEKVHWVHVAAFILTTAGIVLGTAKRGDKPVAPGRFGVRTESAVKINAKNR